VIAADISKIKIEREVANTKQFKLVPPTIQE